MDVLDGLFLDTLNHALRFDDAYDPILAIHHRGREILAPRQFGGSLLDLGEAVKPTLHFKILDILPLIYKSGNR